MGFLKDYGFYKMVTDKDKNSQLIGMILASMDNNESKKLKGKQNNNRKYDKYGRIINKKRNDCEND